MANQLGKFLFILIIWSAPIFAEPNNLIECLDRNKQSVFICYLSVDSVNQIITQAQKFNISSSEEYESIKHSADNSEIPGYSEGIRIVYPPYKHEGRIEIVNILDCINNNYETPKWNCKNINKRRFTLEDTDRKPVYVEGTYDGPLDNYIKLIESANKIMREDYWGHRIYSININIKEGIRNIRYSDYGSHCDTSFNIKYDSNRQKNPLYIDWNSKEGFCI